MNEKKDTKAIFINQLIKLSKDLENSSKLGGLFELTAFFTIMALSIINTEDLVIWAENHLKLLKVTLFVALTIKPIMILTVILLYKLQKFQTIDYEKMKKTLKNFVKDILIIFYKKKEFLIYPLKFIVFQIYFMSKKIRTRIFENQYINSFLIFWVIIDSTFSLIFVLVKVTYLRTYKPNSDFFCKLSGRFEQIFLILTVFSVSLFSIAENFYKENIIVHTGFFLIGLLTLFYVCWVYFEEQPYLNRFTEHAMVQFLLQFTVFFFVKGVTGESGFLRVVEIQVFLSLVVVLFGFNMVRRQDSDGFLIGENNRKIMYIKKVIVQGHRFLNEKDYIQDYGSIVSQILEKKNHAQNLNIWKIFSKLEKSCLKNIKENLKKNTLKSEEQEDNNNKDEEEYLKEEEDHNEDPESHLQIFKKLDSLIFDYFIQDSNRTSYSLFLKITWMAANNMNPSKIFELLEELNQRKKSFTDHYFHQYAKKEISTVFKSIYFNQNLYFNSQNLNQKNSIKNFRSALDGITNTGFDIGYGLRYKERISEMVEMILGFVSLNKKFVDLVEKDKKKYRKMDDVLSLLYLKKKEIKLKFHEIEKNALKVEHLHLTPYFYFLYKCINLQRSASIIFKTHIQRSLQKKKKNFFKEKLQNCEKEEKNFFKDTVVFLISSSKKNFGEVLMSYGDINLKVRHKNFIGKHMNSLIMDTQTEAHDTACQKFLNGKLKNLMKNSKSSFLRIPKSDFFFPVVFEKKIIPFVENNFEFLVGCKFNFQEQNVYIFLNSDLKIEGFSRNFCYLIENSHEFLDKKKMKISAISDKLWKFLKNFSEEKKNFLKENLVNLEEKDELTNSFDNGESIDENEDKKVKLGNFKLRLKNFKNGVVLTKKFDISIIEKKYTDQNLLYYILVLDDGDEHEWKIHKGKKLKKKLILKVKAEKKESDLKPKEINLTEEKNSKKNFEENIVEEKNPENFTEEKIFENPTIKKFRVKRYHFIKDKNEKKIPSWFNCLDHDLFLEDEEKNSNFNKIEEEKPKISLKEKLTSEKKILKNSEKNLKEKEKIQNDEEFFFSSSESNSEPSIYGKKNSEIFSKKNNSFKKTSSIFSQSMKKIHSKYYSFEEIVEKKPLRKKIKKILLIFFLSCSTLIGSMFFLYEFLKKKNSQILLNLKLRSTVMTYSSEMQRYYSNFLRKIAYSEGMIHKDRFKDFYFEDPKVDVSNLLQYEKYKIESSVQTLIKFLDKMADLNDGNLRLRSKSVESDWEVILKTQVNGYKIMPNKTKVEAKLTFVQDLLYQFTSTAFEISKVDSSQFKLNTENLDILYLKENCMNGFLKAVVDFRKNYYQKKFKSEMENFTNNMIISLIIFSVLILGYSISSLIYVIKIKISLKEIYKKNHSISERDIEQRRTELESLEKALKKFKNSNFCEDFMNFQEKNSKKDHTKNKRIKKFFLDNNYNFKLQGSLFAFFVIYTTKILIAGLIFVLFKRNLDRTIWLEEKQTLNIDIIFNTNSLFNAIRQKLILGSEVNFLGIEIDKFIENQLEKRSSTSELIHKFIETRSEDTENDEISLYLQKIKNSSLCEINPDLKNFPKYCEELDDKIPQKGIIQSYVRVSKFQFDLIQSMKTENFDLKNALNDKEFIEIEYSYENVYLRSLIEVMKEIVTFSENHLIFTTENLLDFVIFIVCFWVGISVFLMWFSMGIIEEKLRVSAFGFQVVCIDSVIANAIFKDEFLNFFEVGNSDF